MESKYVYNIYPVIEERIPCWRSEVIKDGIVIKTTTMMSKEGCTKWAGEQIIRMRQEDAIIQKTKTSWVEETFGKKR